MGILAGELQEPSRKGVIRVIQAQDLLVEQGRQGTTPEAANPNETPA